MNNSISNKAMKIFIVLSVILFGGFYEFSSFIMAIALIIIFLLKVNETQKIKVKITDINIFIIVFIISYIISISYAIDKGMAFLGFLKFSTLLIFIFTLMQFEKEEIEDFKNIIPYTATIMVLLTIILTIIPDTRDFVTSENGRFGGPFQYANTFALFILIGFIKTLGKEKIQIREIVILLILLVGILFSQSRIVFILLIISTITILIKNKKITTKKSVIYITITSLITVAIILIFKLDRIINITFSNSTIIGRIIYYKDALQLIQKNPFGCGYMGYCYLEPTIQTAVYTVKYVHNDFLQIALDIGIIPMAIFIVVIVKNILSKENKFLDKLMIIVISIHAFLDIDLQYLSIFMILIILCSNTKTYKKINFKNNAPILKYTISIILIFIYAYFAIALFSKYIGNNEFSTKLYAYNTEAQTDYLLTIGIDKNSNQLANKILQQNENIMYAYYIKSQYDFKTKNWESMEQNLSKVIDLDKYNINNYEDYIIMMSKALEDEILNNNTAFQNKYAKSIIRIEDKLRDLKNNTSQLAYKIYDKPEFELSKEITKYINTLKKEYKIGEKEES